MELRRKFQNEVARTIKEFLKETVLRKGRTIHGTSSEQIEDVRRLFGFKGAETFSIEK